MSQNGTESDDIAGAIERNLAHMGHYSLWTIGIAADPTEREAELQHPAFWRTWEAGSLEEARTVCRAFTSRGMKDDGEHGEQPRVVYVY